MSTKESYPDDHRTEHRKSPPDFPLRSCLWSLLLLGAFVLICVPMFNTPSTDHRPSQSQNNLRQLGLALANYETMHGTFPPAYIPDENGQPMHSWRVLILPFMEHRALYEVYNFDLPWNHPDNLEVAANFPLVFESPYFADHREKRLTTYLAISAEGTMLGTTQPSRLNEDPAERENTLMLIEVPGKPVFWTEPIDISPEEILAEYEQITSTGRSVHVVSADGSVRRLDKDYPPEDLRRNLYLNGNPTPD